MVEQYRPRVFRDLLDFVKKYQNDNFYITENNERKIINDEKTLKKFLKETRSIYIIEDSGDVKGIIGIWKAIGIVERFYVKINAINDKTANNLITVLLWNNRKFLHAKIKKDSSFLNVFKDKGFEFRGDRGKEVLLVINNQFRKSNG
jgi:hypothetical protein